MNTLHNSKLSTALLVLSIGYIVLGFLVNPIRSILIPPLISNPRVYEIWLYLCPPMLVWNIVDIRKTKFNLLSSKFSLIFSVMGTIVFFMSLFFKLYQ